MYWPCVKVTWGKRNTSLRWCTEVSPASVAPVAFKHLRLRGSEGCCVKTDGPRDAGAREMKRVGACLGSNFGGKRNYSQGLQSGGHLCPPFSFSIVQRSVVWFASPSSQWQTSVQFLPSFHFPAQLLSVRAVSSKCSWNTKEKKNSTCINILSNMFVV